MASAAAEFAMDRGMFYLCRNLREEQQRSLFGVSGEAIQIPFDDLARYNTVATRRRRVFDRFYSKNVSDYGNWHRSSG